MQVYLRGIWRKQNMSSKKYFTIRTIVLFICLILAVLAINPNPWAQGIEVKSVRGIAAEQGLKIGDAITSVNGKSIYTLSGFYNALNESSGPNTTYIIQSSSGEIAFISSELPDILVREASKTNIEKGLDLEGGTRVLLRPVS